MKQGLIEARVNNLDDISLKIKDFVNQKSALAHTPFQQSEFFGLRPSSQNKAKRSLTDWRQLYSRNKNKIIPRHTVYPATADGQRIRCTMTGQCNRRKIHSSAQRKTSQSQILAKTRQFKNEKQIEQKRESLIQFAFAQKCYQKQILKQRSDSCKDNKFYNLSMFDRKRRSYWRVNEYLSEISGNEFGSFQKIEATEDYMRRNKDTFQKLQVKPYNHAKIKQICKINNLRFLSQAEQQRIAKQKMNATNGFRFYQRP